LSSDIIFIIIVVTIIVIIIYSTQCLSLKLVCDVVVLQPGTILVQRPIMHPGGLAPAGIRQIVVQRPASLQQIRPGQLLTAQQPTVPQAAMANVTQPVPAPSVQNQPQPKKGLSLTVCYIMVSCNRLMCDWV